MDPIGGIQEFALGLAAIRIIKRCRRRFVPVKPVRPFIAVINRVEEQQSRFRIYGKALAAAKQALRLLRDPGGNLVLRRSKCEISAPGFHAVSIRKVLDCIKVERIRKCVCDPD